MRRIPVVALAVITLTCCVACPSTRDEPLAAGMARVVAIVDGDTLVLDLDGRDEPVRLLGIDTPETNHPTRPVECFGAEATARLAELLPVGSVVPVTRDAEARDHYGRLLLYIHHPDDGRLVNEVMVAEGFAVALHVAPNGAHRSAIAAAEADARASNRGLWDTCGGPGVPIDPLNSR